MGIREIWYVSDTLPSKGLIWDAGGALLLGMLFAPVPGCATGAQGPRPEPGGDRVEVALPPGRSEIVASATTVTFAGSRCNAGSCRCREPGGDERETAPPGEGSKRFEIRISAVGGTASLDLTGLGTVATDPQADKDIGDEGGDQKGDPIGTHETCAYIDVPVGSTHDVLFVAKESVPGRGVAPRLRMAEYGPKGPFWYDLVAVTCEGPDGRCNRRAADLWAVAARQRKRGRLDPCGSAVVTKLGWETSGGQAERRGGLFADFAVSFTMDVKKFATQFAPGSTECLPK